MVPSFAINGTNGEAVGGLAPHAAAGSTAFQPNDAGVITGAAAGGGTLGTSEAYAFNTGGATFGFADGSVKFISQNIDIENLHDL